MIVGAAAAAAVGVARGEEEVMVVAGRVGAVVDHLGSDGVAVAVEAPRERDALRCAHRGGAHLDFAAAVEADVGLAAPVGGGLPAVVSGLAVGSEGDPRALHRVARALHRRRRRVVVVAHRRRVGGVVPPDEAVEPKDASGTVSPC